MMPALAADTRCYCNQPTNKQGEPELYVGAAGPRIGPHSGVYLIVTYLIVISKVALQLTQCERAVLRERF
jgi:hypothetical protein